MIYRLFLRQLRSERDQHIAESRCACFSLGEASRDPQARTMSSHTAISVPTLSAIVLRQTSATAFSSREFGWLLLIALFPLATRPKWRRTSRQIVPGEMY